MTSSALTTRNHTRPRGLMANVGLLVAQPGVFYRTLTVQPATQWLWIGLLILALVGISAVRYETLLSEAQSSALNPQTGPTGPQAAPPGIGKGGGGPGITVLPSGGGGIAPVVPPSGPPPEGPPGATQAGLSPAQTWTTALLAAVGLALNWLAAAALLTLVSLFRGMWPNFSLNLWIAIWASVPLGLMAGLQLLYYAAGGAVGGGGLPALLLEWRDFWTLPVFLQNLLYSLSGQLTVFWLWSLALLYLGARFSLGGRRLVAGFVVLIWVVFVLVTPVAVGSVRAPEAPLPEQLVMPEDTQALAR